MSDIDPIILAVLTGRMEQIAEELDASLFRPAFNPIIAEAHDALHGRYLAEAGDTLVQTVKVLCDGVDAASLGVLMQRHLDDGMATLDTSGTRFERRVARYSLDMAYIGQTHTVSVPLAVTVTKGNVASPTRAEIAQAYEAAYLASYGLLLDVGVRKIINLRSAVIGKRPKFDLSSLVPATTGTAEDAWKGVRQVHFGDAWHETRFYARLDPPVGAVIEWPAILEQPDSTILIEPHLLGTVDKFGNIIIEAKP